jgi:hypothetical protein
MIIVCDFCADEKVVKSYPVKDFVVSITPEAVITSAGAWAACQICADLIDAGNWRLLLRRSVLTFVEKQPRLAELIGLPELRKEIEQVHINFRANRRVT